MFKLERFREVLKHVCGDRGGRRPSDWGIISVITMLLIMIVLKINLSIYITENRK